VAVCRAGSYTLRSTYRAYWVRRCL